MPPSNDHLLHDISARATTDLVFRKNLLKNPQAAVYATFGVKFPAGYRIRFIEKPTELDTLVVLPDVCLPGKELDDDDLDAVAGGDGSGDPW